MSHIAEIDVEIRSLEALQAACRRLGFEFVAGQREYRWFGRYMKDYPLPKDVTVADLGHCDHAIRVPGARYEIGVVQREGEYKLLWDFFVSGGLEERVGPNGQRLVQAYAVEAAKLEAERQGFSCYEEPVQDGAIRLHVQVP